MEQKLSDTLVKAIDRSNPMMQNLQLASRFNKLVEQSGDGGSVTLYAWAESNFGMHCYTYTDNPKAGDTVLAGAKGDLSSNIVFDVVESVEENIINTHINDIFSYSRYPSGDIVLQVASDSATTKPANVTPTKKSSKK